MIPALVEFSVVGVVILMLIRWAYPGIPAGETLILTIVPAVVAGVLPPLGRFVVRYITARRRLAEEGVVALLQRVEDLEARLELQLDIEVRVGSCWIGRESEEPMQPRKYRDLIIEIRNTSLTLRGQAQREVTFYLVAAADRGEHLQIHRTATEQVLTVAPHLPPQVVDRLEFRIRQLRDTDFQPGPDGPLMLLCQDRWSQLRLLVPLPS